MSTAYRKSPDELHLELSEQILAFRSSAASYDLGNSWEAKRLSTSIYTMAFDGSGRTKSLLGMLNLKNKMQFMSSASPPSSLQVIVEMPTSLLAISGSPEKVEYVPMLAESKSKRLVKFSEWWEEKVFNRTSGIPLTRKNLVFTMRTQDGGSHVDEKITDAYYAAFKNGGASPFRFIGGLPAANFEDSNFLVPVNGANAIMRQIAWELDETLKLSGL